MRLRHLALPAAAGLTLLAIPFAPAAVAAPECDPEVNTCADLFAYTGGLQTFTVPAGVTNLIVALGGGAGGNGLEGDDATGGAGGALEAIVPVTPGETLSLVVGGKGGDAVAVDPGDGENPPIPAAAAGGYGGGGAGTAAVDGPVGGGGGGSFIFNSAGTLLVAAGGGGGAGYTGSADAATDGGAGGAGAAGETAPGANGGGGASTTGGGAPGAGDTTIGAGTGGTGPATSPSAFGNGGAAQGTCSAGGGGGGYFGGGSGGCDTTAPADAKGKGKGVSASAVIETIYSAGGGGGGAGFVGNGASQIADFEGATTDNGVIALGYTTAQTTTTLTTTDTTLAPGEEATLDAVVDGAPLTIGDPAEESSAAGKVAAAAFGAKAAALAVPTQPAPAGTTVTPGTACGSTPCTVTFFNNGQVIGDPITVDPATATATVVFTAGSEQGVRNITARYDGNLYYLQSTSNSVAITVSGLANTGPANVAPMIGAAAALLVAGAGLVAFGRRRPQLGAHRAA